ncbi:MAG: hypothetical protein WD467_02675 [Candidatus Saccharimonadales bacterium]
MKARYFVALTVILLGVAILGLRHNNITANNMKLRLIERDRSGEDVRPEVEGTLRDFVFTHMNASINIVLVGEHARASAQAQASTDDTVDGSLYDEAVRVCEEDRGHVTENAQCVLEYVDSRSSEVAEVELPDIKNFSYTYHSPLWIWDTPGLALFGAVLSTVIALWLYARYHTRRLLHKTGR